MRPLLKAYIALIVGGTAVMIAVHLSRLPSSPYPWSWVVVIALAFLSAAAQYMQPWCSWPSRRWKWPIDARRT